MPDDAEIRDLDPYDIFDREAERVAAYFASLGEDAWPRPSRCAGWSIRDVLAHLAAGEEYNQACLEGTVGAYMAGLEAKGATDLDSANALGIAERAGRTPAELLAEWASANADTRRRFRQRGDGLVDTAVGSYPARWQAFHLAAEVATHGDDVYVTVDAVDEPARRDWRARFSRFALAESKPDVAITVVDGETVVHGGGIRVAVGDAELVEVAMGRPDPSGTLTPEACSLLDVG